MTAPPLGIESVDEPHRQLDLAGHRGGHLACGDADSPLGGVAKDVDRTELRPSCVYLSSEPASVAWGPRPRSPSVVPTYISWRSSPTSPSPAWASTSRRTA